MRIAIDLPDRTFNVGIAATAATGATWAQLVADVGGRAPSAHDQLLLDGRVVEQHQPITDSSIAVGSVLSLVTTALTNSAAVDRTAVDGNGLGARPAMTEGAVAITGGLCSGSLHTITGPTITLGRSGDNHIVVDAPSVSRRHATLRTGGANGIGIGEIKITDDGSTNGTWVAQDFAREPTAVTAGQTIALGAVRLEIWAPRSVPTAVEPGDDGLIVFNRPPRMADPPGPPPLTMPGEPRTMAGRSPFSWAMVLAPLAVGLVMARLFSPLFAVFALLSPVMMIASWFEQRRRAKRQGRRSSRDYRRATDGFAASLIEACIKEQRRRSRQSPNPVAIAWRARDGEPTLWERRAHHHDFGFLRAGTATVPWCPPLEPNRSPQPDAIAEVVQAHGLLRDVPVPAAIGPGRVIGVAGHTNAGRALIRSLVVQTAALHGPADVRIITATTTGTAPQWAFTSWLPHQRVVEDEGDVARASNPETLSALEHRLSRSAPPGSQSSLQAVTVVVIDAVAIRANDRDGAVACLALARGLPPQHSAIVLTTSPSELPASCTTVIECVDDDGSAMVIDPATGTATAGVLLDGLTPDQALESARRLARFHDPGRVGDAAQIPQRVDLADLLRASDELNSDAPIDAMWVKARWHRHRNHPGLPALVGANAAGSQTIDLVTDGPHALVGGTTGSGKSELLRTLVASWALSFSPDELTFVLVDYKGGSAFDACAALPHVVGFVTDLDEHLAARALRSLDAELRRRERMLRDAGADSITALRYLRGERHGLPRLVVIIDEFASLVHEVPGFVEALVSVAQRGRSLGVHLILATQRPHGAINDNIRTNTNLRIALRVLDRGDSVDVVGTGDAAAISRMHPGRALMSIGSDPPHLWHAALVSTASDDGDPSTKRQPRWVRLDEFGAPMARVDATSVESVSADSSVGGRNEGQLEREGQQTDLTHMVAAITEAFAAAGGAPPRRPWLPPLPNRIVLGDLNARHDTEARGQFDATIAPSSLSTPTAVRLGITDQPDRQLQGLWSWHLAGGPLLLYGMPGSGTTNALVTVAAQITTRFSPAQCHLYVIEAGSSALTPLADLPQVGAVINFDERARCERLIRWLDGQRRARITRPMAALPALFVLIDGAAHLRHTFDDAQGLRSLETLQQLAATGPAVGIHLAMTGDRPQAIPSAVAAMTTNKLVFRLPDAYDYSLLGLHIGRLDGPPGRAVTTDGTEVQVAIAELGVGEVAGSRRDYDDARPHPIGVLPALVERAQLPAAACDDARWQLPIGIADSDLGPCSLDLAPDDHVLAAGPARSGRTSLLRLLATTFTAANLGAVVALAPRPSTLRDELGDMAVATAGDLFDLIEATSRSRRLVLIDDAELIDDVCLTALITGSDASLRVIVAGHAERLRHAYGHWTRPLTGARMGVALRPARADAGDLWNVRLSAAGPVGGLTGSSGCFGASTGAPGAVPEPTNPPGRSMLIIDGHAEIIQLARP